MWDSGSAEHFGPAVVDEPMSDTVRHGACFVEFPSPNLACRGVVPESALQGPEVPRFRRRGGRSLRDGLRR